MFNFENANEEQIEAIKTTEGPLLLIAGPGTGKTYTLVKRTIYLITEKNIKPENIMIATFTEKAAKEIVTRITNELEKLEYSININEMYIGTFHSICLRIIKENIEYTDLSKNYRILDSFEQEYLIYRNLNKFQKIKNFDSLNLSKLSYFKKAQKIAKYINILTEELVETDKLKNDSNVEIATLGNIIEEYDNILIKSNIMDFAHIQIKTYNLLKDNLKVLDKIRNRIKYLMIDEYQDTNYVQEKLAFLIENNNICVVGDDDQGLYRFRGATIRNIIEFPNKFEKSKCIKINLTKNYRSEKDIIDFYNMWMKTTYGEKFDFNWKNFRFSKEIVPARKNLSEISTVVKISGKDEEKNWEKEILEFLNYLINNKMINNYNQVAFLFKSVKNDKVVELANYLEENNIGVYSPRSNMFFKREEIKNIIGIMLLVFPQYIDKLRKRSFKYNHEEILIYYEECIKSVEKNVMENEELQNFIRNTGISHMNLFGNTDYAFSGLMYRFFQFEPFYGYLNVDLNNGIVDQRKVRNLSIFSQIVSKYDYLQNISVFSPKKIEKDVEIFFNTYLRFLYEGGIGEYEDESEYAPSGCITFSTIHQSKGMEFPIVVVDSLGNVPRDTSDKILNEIEEKYYHRKVFEPQEDIKYFDFWRLYYTAFSRAQNLLVLTCPEKENNSRIPSEYFKKIYEDVVEYKNVELNKLKINNIKKVNIKNQYSFTSNISIYENCALQYKFIKELGFSPVRVGSTIFGELIHQTIEDIHKAVLREECETINKENIQRWFDINYETISKCNHSYLGKAQLKVALDQVIKYVKNNEKNFKRIKESEVEISLVKPEYILNGVVDLIESINGEIDIIDFKSEKKPDIFSKKEELEKYKKQLQIYAYLIEKNTGKKVSKTHLYYTGEEQGVPIITFINNKEDVEKTITEFDEIVKKIENKEFNCKSKSQKICDNCDMRFFCKK